MWSDFPRMHNTCEDVSHHRPGLLVIGWWSGEMTTELLMCTVFVLEGDREVCVNRSNLTVQTCLSRSWEADGSYWVADVVLLMVELSLHGLAFLRAFLLAVGRWGPWLGLGWQDPQVPVGGQPRTRSNSLQRNISGISFISSTFCTLWEQCPEKCQINKKRKIEIRPCDH